MSASRARLARRVAERTPVLLVYFDADLRVRFANRHLRELLGHRPSDVYGRPLAELLDPRTLKYALAHKAELERGNLAPRDYVLRDKQGRTRYVQVRAAPDCDASGRPVGFIACTARRRRRLDCSRQDLLEAANHELRTPLASVIAALELLRDGAKPHGIDTTSSFAGVALQSAQRLERVLERWLDLDCDPQ
jgi:PAS domain S-box-containing protein